MCRRKRKLVATPLLLSALHGYAFGADITSNFKLWLVVNKAEDVPLPGPPVNCTELYSASARNRISGPHDYPTNGAEALRTNHAVTIPHNESNV